MERIYNPRPAEKTLSLKVCVITFIVTLLNKNYMMDWTQTLLTPPPRL